MGEVHDGAFEEDDDFIMALLPIHDAAGDGDLEQVMRLVQEDPQVVNIIDGIDEERTPFIMPLGLIIWRWPATCWTRGPISTPLILMGKQLCMMHLSVVIWGW